MTVDAIGASVRPHTGPLAAGASAIVLEAGEFDIAGRRYANADRLAVILGVSRRTLGRWDAMRIGPPKIKIGKLVLFDLAKLPDWLASRESEPVRANARCR